MVIIMEQNISNYQSLFQLLTVIYLVAEWVSLEKIGSYIKLCPFESATISLEVHNSNDGVRHVISVLYTT